MSTPPRRREANGLLGTASGADAERPAQAGSRTIAAQPFISRFLLPLMVAVAVSAIVAVVMFELTVGRGWLFTERGVFPPYTEAGSTGRLSRYVLVPLSIGLVAGLVASVLLTRRLIGEIRSFGQEAQLLTRGEIETLDVERTDEIGMVNRAFMDLYGEVQRMQGSERAFLVRVSHELRTPIAAIRGQTEALADGLFADDADRHAAYGAILSEADRLERLVGDLMDLARMRADGFGLARDEIDPVDLLGVAAQSVAVSAQRAGVEVHVEYDGLTTIIGDGDRLLQVIGNLLRNAIRWTPRGGRIDLRARLDGDAFEVVVDDSGVGIAPGQRERIFDMFYSESGSGSGVGLAITRDLVQLMGGDIGVGDSPAGGARFTVRVPRAAGPQRSQVV